MKPDSRFRVTREELSSVPTSWPAFRGLPRTEASRKAARAIVMPVTWAPDSSRRARIGPRALLEVSNWIGGYEEESGLDPSSRGIYTISPIQAERHEVMQREVYAYVDRTHTTGRFPVIIGADRLAGLGAVEALHRRGCRFGVLQIDAHRHLQNEGETFGAVSNWFTRSVRTMGVPTVLAGIRGMSESEFRSLLSERIPFMTARGLAAMDPVRAAFELGRHFAGDVYISVDFSALDPLQFPAVEQPVAFGLSMDFLGNILTSFAGTKRILGIDFCGLAPIPGNPAYESVAAALVNRTLAALAKANAF
ncbi:MAG: arginase family protein [Candidatus Sumerlaeia bacterium]|nr:arginase family protein [Candidatus Sumerlaeia bacterium]